MLLVASETGHVYTFATRKLQPMITSESGKALIQTCLNSPDPTPTTVQQTAPQNQIETVTVNPEVAQTIQPAQSEANEQRMSETGYEETSFQCQNNDEDVKVSIFIKWTPPPPASSLAKNKNQTHVEEVGHTSEFLFATYWWTWKTTLFKKLLKWANKKMQEF